MSLQINVPGPLFLEEGGRPLYTIAQRGYVLKTLSCVGVDRGSSQPLLAASSRSSARVPRGIYELAIPIMKEGKPVAAKVLPLLKALKDTTSVKRNLIAYEGIKVPES
jgi:hypothetical protein